MELATPSFGIECVYATQDLRVAEFLPGFCELRNPSTQINRVASLHRLNIVSSDEKSVLRRNKGHIALAGFEGHQTPNIEAHLGTFKAAPKYEAGPCQVAISSFREVFRKFREYSEVLRVLEGGLLFPLGL